MCHKKFKTQKTLKAHKCKVLMDQKDFEEMMEAEGLEET